MPAIRFILLGGFLGAGKTTTIARLARAYQQRGLRVGIVTNDQAAELVDTHTLRSQGFDVGEVAGACFCCNFNDLTATVEQLGSGQRPDIVLAEPVGSCTDLVATVIQPILRLYGDAFEVAPYGVILKPSHGLRILRGEEGAGFSPKAAYIFRKQLEEADFLIINRIDELSRSQVEELTALVQSACPGVPVLRISARSGENFDSLLSMLDQQGAFGQRILELDYDIYAAGEAELGWLNASFRVTAGSPFSLDELLVNLVERLRQSLSQAGAETAHLKTIGLWEGFFGVSNLVSRDSPAELSQPSHCRTAAAEVVVNARVAAPPELLDSLVDQSVSAVCAAVGGRYEPLARRSLRPGRPVPTHRFAEPLQR
jgi:G3E family GTPase